MKKKQPTLEVFPAHEYGRDGYAIIDRDGEEEAFYPFKKLNDRGDVEISSYFFQHIASLQEKWFNVIFKR